MTAQSTKDFNVKLDLEKMDSRVAGVYYLLIDLIKINISKERARREVSLVHELLHKLNLDKKLSHYRLHVFACLIWLVYRAELKFLNEVSDKRIENKTVKVKKQDFGSFVLPQQSQDDLSKIF